MKFLALVLVLVLLTNSNVLCQNASENATGLDAPESHVAASRPHGPGPVIINQTAVPPLPVEPGPVIIDQKAAVPLPLGLGPVMINHSIVAKLPDIIANGVPITLDESGKALKGIDIPVFPTQNVDAFKASVNAFTSKHISIETEASKSMQDTVNRVIAALANSWSAREEKELGVIRAIRERYQPAYEQHKRNPTRYRCQLEALVALLSSLDYLPDQVIGCRSTAIERSELIRPKLTSRITAAAKHIEDAAKELKECDVPWIPELVLLCADDKAKQFRSIVVGSYVESATQLQTSTKLLEIVGKKHMECVEPIVNEAKHKEREVIASLKECS
ncbi:uncharacterized protein LOC119661662 [Hermetia illucens]|uniref:uncharacterized protein LOC119661662 n=1 Tax=Hermetia illucens TaxID=343691 RepID=UPI0018CC1008|nr:uncharacterized protein LOC119661662 [Hermetia illucens]